MDSPDQSNARRNNANKVNANTAGPEQPEHAPAGEQQKEPGAWRGVLILCAICALFIGGIAVFAWLSPSERDILDDERIDSTGTTSVVKYGEGDSWDDEAEGGGIATEEVFFIKLADGVTSDEAFELLSDLNEHNRNSSGEDMVRSFMLFTNDGAPLWNLTERFMALDGNADNVRMAFWLAEQNHPMSWSTDSNDGKPVLSIALDEEYKDLSFQRSVVDMFPSHRVSVSYKDAPTVSVPFGQSFVLDDVEKLIDAWCADPLTYGDINRFYFDDFTRDGDQFIDGRGVKRNQIRLNIRFEVAEGDPAYYDDRRPSPRDGMDSATLNERERERWREIADRLFEEGKELVPDYAITF